MQILSRVFPVLAIASVSAGLTLWITVPGLLAKQEEHFDSFLRTATGLSTNTLKEVEQLRRKVVLSAGLYPGWPQAVLPFAMGAALFATSRYFRQRMNGGQGSPSNAARPG